MQAERPDDEIVDVSIYEEVGTAAYVHVYPIKTNLISEAYNFIK